MEKLLILGLGISGQAAARLADHKGIRFDTYDDSQPRADLPTFQLRHFCSHQGNPALASYDLLVVSPGYPPAHPLVQQALELGLPLVSEVEFAYRYAFVPCLGITGSNGKSTTTALLHHLLQHAGIPATCCGNIGHPFSLAVLEEGVQAHVLELSSFQLEHIRHFHVCAGALINLTPDHMDHHGSMEAYRAAKLRLFANQVPGDHAFVPAALRQLVPGGGSVHAIDQPQVVEGRLQLCPQGSIDLRSFPLLGRHNLQNLAFAASLANSFGVAPAAIEAALASFQGLPHRLKVLGTFQGRTWIDDSKATNPEATLVAMEAMEQPFVLILGGSLKGSSFSLLRQACSLLTGIVAYGQAASQIAHDLHPYPVELVARFDQACQRAHERAADPSCVLLSPACASFDQFANYRERGKRFATLFAAMGRDE
jgi:UDP-N-acetylmuramoylalanine--D-glutamate ligase